MHVAIKHPAFRVKAFELIDISVRAPLTSDIINVLKNFEFFRNIIDVIVIGGYGGGYSQIWSDMDFAFVLPDDQSQKDANLFFRNTYKDTWEKLSALEDQHKINLDFFVLPFTAKENFYCYSLFEDKPFNRAPKETPTDRVIYKYSEQKYVRVPFHSGVYQIAKDPFEAEVPYWEELYGDEFQWLS